MPLVRRIRRTLLGGLGFALAVSANPATGQDSRTAPPAPRTARLGRPVAIPETPPPDPGVTPAGLLARGQAATSVPTPMPPSSPGVPGGGYPAPGVPTAGYPAPGVPGGGYPMGGFPVPGGAALPGTLQPKAGGTPSVTETRTPNPGVPVGPGYPPPGYPLDGYPLGGYPGYPVGGDPYLVPGPGVVPSVGPEGGVVGPPGLEAPLYGDCPPGAAGIPAVGRVAGCGKWYGSGEYLLWWSQSDSLPPLVTTSSPQFNGIPGQGDTRAVFGGSFGQMLHNGGRLTVGRWFGDGQCRAVEGRLFFVGQQNTSAVFTTGQFPVLARPFNNVNTPVGPFSEVVASPGLAVGGVAVKLQNEAWGAEANYRRFLFGNPMARVDGIVGFRYLGIKEQLTITENFVRVPGSNPGVGIPALFGTITDSFRTENQFYGGQIGLVGEFRRGRWSVDGRASVAFGNLYQTLEINGGQSLAMANGAVLNYAGGLLALPGANIGSYSQSQFAVIPEAGVNVG